MRGFFSDDELTAHIQKYTPLEPQCNKCTLHLKCKSPKMGVTGEGRKKVLIISESPGKAEDTQGKQLIGEAGQLLRQYLDELGLDLDKDFWKMNSVSCYSSKTPTKAQIKYCKPLVDRAIRELQPEMIWLVGGVATESFFTGRFKNTTISRWVNLCVPDKPSNAWVISLYHPSYIKRRKFDKNLESEFRRNLKFAISCMGRKPYTHEDFSFEKFTESITSFDRIVLLLNDILKKSGDGYIPLYIDYETTGLKPHWKGSRIVTVSLCMDANKAYAFPFQYKDFFSFKQIRKIKGLLRKVLTNENIGVMAHNMKFEDSWTRNILGVDIANWVWDTMIAAHIIDNRRSYTGLKFQSYVNFGVDPYDGSVSKYLRAPSDSHSNNIDQAPIDDLLYYNCLDTLLGMRLYQKQQENFTLTDQLNPKNKLSTAYNLFHEGILALSDVQENGVLVKEGYYEQKDVEVGARIDEIKKELLNSGEIVKWNSDDKETVEITKRKEFKIGSNADLGKLLYDILGEEKVLTDKGNYKVDKETIEGMDIPFVKKLLEMRKLEKVRGTYFSQIKREVCNGIIHPFYDLHIPVSYRSASHSPNWQNIPGHCPIAAPLVRRGIVPPKGWFIGEADYSSIEVKIAAITTQDPSLIKYVNDPETDMHRDSACDIWLIPQEQVTKNIRYNAKGGFVFPEFYGDFYVHCGEELWKMCVVHDEPLADGTPMSEHLHNKGIHKKENFITHLKGVEDIFWNQRFKVYKQWKKEINKFYRRKGYVENFFGFRFTGYMNEKETTNYPIQSTAFHILLESLIEVNKISLDEDWQSYPIGQIHDSILLYIHPDEKDHVIKTCNRVMSKDVPDRHDWLTVPTGIEFELSDKSWWEKEEVPIPQ